MTRPRRGPLRLLRESAQIKTLALLFVTMCVACLATYLFIFFNMHGQVYKISSEIIERRAQYLVETYHHSDQTLDQVVEQYRQGVGALMLFDAFSDLPPMRGVIVESDMRDGVVYFSAQRDVPFGVIRVEGRYLVIPPYIYNWETNAIQGLVIHTLLLCALIASVCTVIAIHRAYQPLRKLDAAISRVARGDFSARVDVKRCDEIGKIARNFNWMTSQLERIEYLRRDFVSSVSHEFKTPLAAVQGSARMLAALPKEKLTEQKLKKYTGLILDETARMTNLSSNLLRLTRLEHQTVAENVTEFSLDEQLRGAILALESQWSAKKLQLEIQLEPLNCQGDEELLYQAWLNLLTNAIKFSHERGLLSVCLREAEGMLQVELGDSGDGMSEETMRRVFEKFYQGDPSRKTEGSGLGLSIVKRIVDLHGGDIFYRSAPGQGTLCTVRLPARQEHRRDAGC